jgi:hypothetical protein
MPNLYFHIGLHKTATGWLQKILFPRLEGIQVHETRSERDIRILAGSEGRHLITHEGMSGKLARDKEPGTYRQRLLSSLELIREVSPAPCIMVGFREQRAWINSAFSQKAKKAAIDQETYLRTYAPNELCWREVLNLVEKTAAQTFPYLYEEFSSDPAALINDMCRFLGVTPPVDLDRLLQERVNLSPRTDFGQRIAQPFFKLSYSLDRLGLRTKPLRNLGARLGARIDGYGARQREIDIDTATEKLWREDWAGLVRQVSELRNRQFVSITSNGGLKS